MAHTGATCFLTLGLKLTESCWKCCPGPWWMDLRTKCPVIWMSWYRQSCTVCVQHKKCTIAEWHNGGEDRQEGLRTAHPVWLFPLALPPLLLVTAELVVHCPDPVPLLLKRPQVLPLTSDQVSYGPQCIFRSRDFCLILLCQSQIAFEVIHASQHLLLVF